MLTVGFEDPQHCFHKEFGFKIRKDGLHESGKIPVVVSGHIKVIVSDHLGDIGSFFKASAAFQSHIGTDICKFHYCIRVRLF